MSSGSKAVQHIAGRAVAVAISDYLDNTARAHSCPGFDCKLCALNGDRLAEATGAAEDALAKIPLIAAAPELLKELESGYHLILKSVTHVTHGKPTLEEATAWLKSTEELLRKAREGQ